jgi:shikimate dehydrogenase
MFERPPADTPVHSPFRTPQPTVPTLSDSSLQEIMCCIGQPVAGNPTQYMMEKCFAAAGLDCRYLTLEVAPEQLPDALLGMRAMGFRGAHLMAPHKTEAPRHLDRLTRSAELAMMANFIYRDEDGAYVGENTDGKAACASLSEVTDIPGKNIVVLGAGDVARAISVEAGLSGATDITIVNRSAERGQGLADLLNERVKVSSMFIPWSGDYEVATGTDIVINATSIESGDSDARIPLKISSLKPEMVVADVVCNPPQTRLLRDAAEQGCTTVNGLQMLVRQGVISFATWTGVEPDADVMREALEEFLEL